MASNQAAIYDSYLKRTTANNVKPRILRDAEVWAFLKENGVGAERFQKPDSYETRFWDGHGRRFSLSDGRVAEYSTTNSAMPTPLLAVFETASEYFDYRRPLGMFHYLYT